MSSVKLTPEKASKNRLKKMISARSTTLTADNPDIYTANPKPSSGFRKIPSTSFHSNLSSSSRMLRKSENNSETSLYYTTSRQKIINETIGILSKSNMYSKKINLDRAVVMADEMLAVTISCVMLMAAKVPNIPEEYLTHAERYLSCIKDDNDNYSPNIQGILQHIHCLRSKLKSGKGYRKDDMHACLCASASESSSEGEDESDNDEFAAFVKKSSTASNAKSSSLSNKKRDKTSCIPRKMKSYSFNA